MNPIKQRIKEIDHITGQCPCGDDVCMNCQDLLTEKDEIMNKQSHIKTPSNINNFEFLQIEVIKRGAKIDKLVEALKVAQEELIKADVHYAPKHIKLDKTLKLIETALKQIGE